jgi:hypothetical protein
MILLLFQNFIFKAASLRGNALPASCKVKIVPLEYGADR